jgi:hypothetical protein
MFFGFQIFDSDFFNVLLYFCRDIKNQVPSGFGFGAAMAYCSPPMGFSQVRAMPMMFSAQPMAMMCGAPPPRMLARKKCLSGGPVCGGMAFADSDLNMDSYDAGEMDVVEMCLSESSKAIKVEDKLTSLVDLQSSDGHFRWDDIVSSHAGKTKDELMLKRPDATVNEDLWITAIIITMLEAMKEDKDLWELVVMKAKKFLAKTMSQDQIEMLLVAAAGAVQTA